MRHLPDADPGTPDTRSRGRFLLWAAMRQWRTLVPAMGFGVVWMSCLATVPYVIGRAIDEGLSGRDVGTLVAWSLGLVAIGVVQATAGLLRHRFAVSIWLGTTYAVIQLVARHVARTGPALRARLGGGEVVAAASGDAAHIGGFVEVLPRFCGAVVSFALVAVLLVSTSVPLGLLVLVGAPVCVLLLGPVLAPLQRRQEEQRAEVGRLTALGADTVAGLRVLRGVGGEETFLRRYVERSSAVRDAGVRVAGLQATLDASQVLLPGMFVVLVTWVGARLAVEGSLAPGELVTCYGYAVFLVTPLRTATELADRLTRALVGTGRLLTVLAVPRDVRDPLTPAGEPPVGSALMDERSGLVVRPGRSTALVSADPDETARLADRLGRLVDDDGVTLGGVRLTDLPVAAVRRRIVVSDTEPYLFGGPLQESLGATTEDAALGALATAAAEEVVAALPSGLATVVEERGRSFSGGQRQRLVLARALLADPEVLVLVDPTSAVDAHTEARVAERLRGARAGRTTVLVTASPLLLDRVDHVVLVVGGRVRAEGRHRDLLARSAAYRSTVTREEEA